jgi:uncharacterized membrane protein
LIGMSAIGDGYTSDMTRTSMCSIKSRFPYYTALLVEAMAFHRHVLFYRGFLFPWDFRAVHLPLATLVADSFRRGQFPLWDPYTYCGNPIFANIQAAVFYPPVIAATLAGAWLGVDLLPRLLAVSVVLQIVFAGLCAFELIRRLDARPAAAWIGATVYELGFFLPLRRNTWARCRAPSGCL